MTAGSTYVPRTASIEELVAATREYLPEDRVTAIQEAFRFAAEAHDGQLRLSGDDYITHPVATALTCAALGLDGASIEAALLHDVQEDCAVPNDVIAKRFGPEVAKLVDGVTKLDRLTWMPERGHEGLQAENLRKMFLAMAEDIRVVIIKLCDRLHNMRTLDAQPRDKQLRIAQETMDIYAPLASRLGIWQIKWQLEDLAFRYLHPEEFKQVSQLIASKRASREKYIAQVETILREELAKNGIEADVRGRAKHLYSIYEKMRRYAEQGKSFNEIYDLLALRVLVNTVGDCYNALGVVHALWHPIPGQFDDYIANPKESLYQSLHTTVMCLGARPIEVQIRTYEMHQISEYGVAAHWHYKEGGRRDVRFEERLSWLRQLLEWQRDITAAEEFVESVKTDIFRDQVFVYTPKGQIKDLPAGATPLDFAFRIHTDLGYRCVGGKVNGRLVPLNYQLKNGDVVEIISSKADRGPSLDWLNPNLGYVKTTHAREKIRQWFKRQERSENIARGRELLDKELRRVGLTLSESQDELLRAFKYEALDDFLAAIGHGGVSLHAVALRLAALLPQAPIEEEPHEAAPSPPVYTSSIQVLGTGDLLTQLARCCNPVPGDDIIGYVTRSRGVTVHRQDCWNVIHEDERERLVDVEWGRSGQRYPVAVRIEAWDRVGLLRDVSTLVAAEEVNMVGVRTQEHADRTTSVFLTLETTGVAQLTRLLGRLEAIKGVISVSRAMEGQRRTGSL